MIAAGIAHQYALERLVCLCVSDATLTDTRAALLRKQRDERQQEDEGQSKQADASTGADCV